MSLRGDTSPANSAALTGGATLTGGAPLTQALLADTCRLLGLDRAALAGQARQYAAAQGLTLLIDGSATMLPLEKFTPVEQAITAKIDGYAARAFFWSAQPDEIDIAAHDDIRGLRGGFWGSNHLAPALAHFSAAPQNHIVVISDGSLSDRAACAPLLHDMIRQQPRMRIDLIIATVPQGATADTQADMIDLFNSCAAPQAPNRPRVIRTAEDCDITAALCAIAAMPVLEKIARDASVKKAMTLSGTAKPVALRLPAPGFPRRSQ